MGAHGESLNPSPLARLSRSLRPDWSRTLAARRLVAAGLVVLAAVAALRDDPGGELGRVVVASRDLSPGEQLAAADVEAQNRTATTIPAGSPGNVDDVVGASVTGPVRRGEVLTDVRLLSPRLAESAAGPNARIVPLPLTDAAVAGLLRAGDVVDVIATRGDDDAELIATGAVVVLVSADDGGVTGGDRVVLVALPDAVARTVAAAALVQAIAVTLH